MQHSSTEHDSPEQDSPGRDAEAPLLRAENVVKHFPVGRGGRRSRKVLRAVDGVSFSLRPGETLAIVGESGSGKSTLARTLLRLVEPTSGSVHYRDRDLVAMSAREVRSARRHIQMIFQDPYASLHPMQTTAQIISEPWKVHRGIVAPRDFRREVAALLDQVGLPRAYADMYPSRLSGGERQRIAIARALALRPEILVLDEPVSALDVSIQAQVIKLLMTLQQELGLSYIFISHDLALVRLIADRVAVMYLGTFVEQGDVATVYEHPAHPYTRALLDSSPALRDGASLSTEPVTATDPGSPLDLPRGCRFRPRCGRAQDICASEAPGLAALGGTDHVAACHFADIPTEPGH